MPNKRFSLKTFLHFSERPDFLFRLLPVSKNTGESDRFRQFFLFEMVFFQGLFPLPKVFLSAIMDLFNDYKGSFVP